MRKFLMAAGAALALGAAAPAMAQTQVYTAPSTPGGNQSWTGSLGLDFTVNGAIEISSLGAFDAGVDGVTNIFVGIYDASTMTLLLSTTISGTGTVGNPFVFQSVAPYVLGPGSYQLVAWGYDGTDQNYNNSGPGGPILFNSMGGRLTATGTRYSSGTGFATIVDNGTTRYGSASFFAVAVPEPGTWAMMIGGFGLAGGMMRRRSKKLAIA